MRNSLMAINASRAVLRHRFVLIRRRRGLLRERHGAWRMTAAALCGIIRFQILPDVLRHLESMSVVFGGRVEFRLQMTPRIPSPRFNVAHEGRHERGWNMAVGARCLNAEHIGVMLAMPVFLEWRVHLVARCAEGFC